MTGGSVPHYLFAPDRDISLRAVSRALLKVRALSGMTIPKVAEALGCSADTVKDASNEFTLLTFDKIARLVYLFPEQCEPIFELWNREPTALTAEEHRAAIEHHTAELVRLTRGAGA
jgi:plasmid maintenance system antidote protein VapI